MISKSSPCILSTRKTSWTYRKKDLSIRSFSITCCRLAQSALHSSPNLFLTLHSKSSHPWTHHPAPSRPEPAYDESYFEWGSIVFPLVTLVFARLRTLRHLIQVAPFHRRDSFSFHIRLVPIVLHRCHRPSSGDWGTQPHSTLSSLTTDPAYTKLKTKTSAAHHRLCFWIPRAVNLRLRRGPFACLYTHCRLTCKLNSSKQEV